MENRFFIDSKTEVVPFLASMIGNRFPYFISVLSVPNNDCREKYEKVFGAASIAHILPDLKPDKVRSRNEFVLQKSSARRKLITLLYYLKIVTTTGVSTGIKKP